MMLGTAASSSIATPTGRLSHTGAISVRKMAIPKLTGIASSSASTELTSVPYTGASAPNCSVTGFQTSRVRKLSLKWANAGQAPARSDTATPPSSASTRVAAMNVALRKTRSRSRCPAACRGSMAATVFIADGNLSRCVPRNRTRRPPVARGGRRSSSTPTASAPSGGRAEARPARTLHPLGVRGRARQARRTLDLRLPGSTDLLDQALRQRDVVQLGRHLGTVVIGPVEKLERFTGCGRIRRHCVHQDEAHARDRPGLLARLIGEDQVIARRMSPVGARGRRLERLGAGNDRLARLVDETGVRHVGLLGVGVLDIADSAVGLVGHVGDAFVTLGPDP